MTKPLLLILFFNPFFNPATEVVAGTNLREGSYTHSVDDIYIEKLNFKLTRTYNSRSNDIGVFGFGWCSLLDKKIEVNRNDLETTAFYIHYSSCLDGIQQKYTLIPDLKNTAPWSIDKDRFVLTKPDGSREIFSKTGALLAIQSRNFNLSISFPTPTEMEVLLNSERLMIKRTASEKFITSISYKDTKTNYVYEKFLLTGSESGSKKLRYTYDSIQNLTAVISNGITDEFITYDMKTDTVQTIQFKSGCEQKFTYSGQNQNDHYIQIAESKMSCADKHVGSESATFTFNKQKDGLLLLAKSTMKQNGRTTLTTIWNERGLPVEVQRQNETHRYIYDEKGRLTEIRNGKKSFRYTYNTAGQISQIADDQNRRMDLTYDAGGQLRKVIHNGSSSILFDESGRYISSEAQNSERIQPQHVIRQIQSLIQISKDVHSL